ncbi:hypothetical protein ACFX2A_040913 [Malus domestica]
MVALYKLKTLRFSCIAAAASRIKRFAVRSQILCRHLTSEISEDEQNLNLTANYLINSCGLTPKGAISASKWIELQSPERADSVLTFFRSHGFSATQISKILRSCPQLLNSHPDKTLLPKLEFFSSFIVSGQDLAKTLAYSPTIWATSLEKRILPTYHFLRSLLSAEKVVSVLKRGSWIFVEGHSKKVAPNIRILRQFGMPDSHISLLLAYYPGVLMLKPQKFGELVDEVRQIGFKLEKATFVKALSALCGKTKLKYNRSREVYRKWGWSDDDFLSAFTKDPQCILHAEKKIMQVMDLLVNKMGWPSTTIVKYPVVLCYSLDKRIIPRCSVVKVLLLKGLIKEIGSVSLSTMFSPTEKCFWERFVDRYIDEVPALLSVYQGRVEIQDV